MRFLNEMLKCGQQPLLSAITLIFLVLGPFPLWAQIVVTNANDSGAGSLRQAILDARDGVPTSITFAPGIGTINVLSLLPELVDPGDAIDGAQQVILNAVGLTSTDDHGLRIFASDISISGLTIQNFGGNGIRIQPDPNAPTGTSNQVLTGIIVRDNIVGKNVDGIVLFGGRTNNQIDALITENIFPNNTSDGIVVNGSFGSSGAGGNVIDVVISNNIIQASAGGLGQFDGDGIRVLGGVGNSGGNNMIRALITDNTASSNIGEGIRVAGTGTGSNSSNNEIDATITGNTIQKNGGSAGITVAGGPTVLVPATPSGNLVTFYLDSNQVKFNQNHGIAIRGNAGSHHVVRGSIRNNNQSSSNGDRGLHICGGDCGNGSASADHNQITDILLDENSFSKNGRHGIRADLGSGVGNVITFTGVTNNVANNNGRHGILIRAGINGSGATPISGNRSDRNQGNRDGIRITSTGYVLTGNRAENNARFGIIASGNLDGGGNRSRRNGDPSCDPSGCF